jgi:hypothetical protein
MHKGYVVLITISGLDTCKQLESSKRKDSHAKQRQQLAHLVD